MVDVISLRSALCFSALKSFEYSAVLDMDEKDCPSKIATFLGSDSVPLTVRIPEKLFLGLLP